MTDIEGKRIHKFTNLPAQVHIRRIEFDDLGGVPVVHIYGRVWVDTPLKGSGGLLGSNFNESFCLRNDGDNGDKLLGALLEMIGDMEKIDEDDG